MEVGKIRNICGIGTGIMGSSIALVFAMAGYHVNMFGRSEASIKRGLNSIGSALETFRENGLVEPAGISEILGRIKGVTTLEEAAEGANFVIESVDENLAVKQQVFAQMEKLCQPQTILASNTSGLSPTAIAQVLEYQDRFIVTHFWNPPHLLPLVEVVPGKNTAPRVVDITWHLMETIGKKPVALKREAMGFIGNRLQVALLREALYIVESGIATKEAVDTTVKYSLGRRFSAIGPLENMDLSGLDIFYNVFTYLVGDLCNAKDVSPLLQKSVEIGNLGAKTGTGLYDWTPEALTDIKKTRDSLLLDWLRKDRESNCR